MQVCTYVKDILSQILASKECLQRKIKVVFTSSVLYISIEDELNINIVEKRGTKLFYPS